MHDLRPKILSESEISQAKHLLYQVYVQDMNWRPPQNNPSQWRIETLQDKPILSDRYDSQSQWFGVAANSKRLLACCRVIGKVGSALEIDNYTSLFQSRGNGIDLELNRLAVDAEYRQSAIPIQLIQFVIETLSRGEGKQLLIAPTYPSPADLCLKLGFQAMKPDIRFRYHPNDPMEVNLLRLNLEDKVALERMIEACGTIVERLSA